MRHPSFGSRSRLVAPLTLAAGLLSALLAPPAAAQGTPVGFAEVFALAPDRLAVLDQLVPGTQDHYFYSCLAHQQRGDLGRVDELLGAWKTRHDEDGRWGVIDTRQVYLRHAADPAATYRELRDRLGLRFDQQRERRADELDLPSRLDPALVSDAALRAEALRRSRDDLDGFTDHALRGLVGGDWNDAQLRALLSRLDRPDVPNLPELVVRDLAAEDSRGFGSLGIHGRLLLDQLEACAALRPALLKDDDFQAQVLRRLRPSDDVDLAVDVDARRAYLERLQAFAARLAPASNSLKAHVLHHRLRFDLEQGVFDRERLIAYLRLPRRSTWVRQEYLEENRLRGHLVSEDEAFATGLGVIGGDDALVRAHLAHHLAADGGVEAFGEWVDRRYLERLLAETNILAGTGDMERWYTLLDDPAYYERLKERVELEFPATQSRSFAANEPVVLELDVKNVETLLVKVFEVQARNYYLEQGREVDASIDLDGLVAGRETTHTYSEGPLRRVRRRFEFPELDRPGVYVVDFIGNGTSSRAVVRKGRLEVQQRLGSAGHVLQVLDETGALRPDARALFGGRELVADEHGEILVPYSSGPGEKPLVLVAGDRVGLTSLDHRAEAYDLDLGVYLERETLVAGETGVLLLRGRLTVNDVPVDLGLLEGATLRLRTIDAHGAQDELVRELEGLSEDADHRLEFPVPDDLAYLSVSVQGEVKSLSLGEDVTVSAASELYEVNRLARTEHTAFPALVHTPAGKVVELRGRAGEVRPDVPLTVRLWHRDYRRPTSVTLRTDASGRVHLGPLTEFVGLSVEGAPAGPAYWELESSERTYPRLVHLGAGEVGRVPTLARPGTELRAAVSLLELRDDHPAFDRIGHARLEGGYVVLRDLPPGDHVLTLHEDGVTVHVRVTDGVDRAGYLVGAHRALERVPTRPLQVVGATVEDDHLVVRLDGLDAGTRVHVAAGRFHPAFDGLRDLSLPFPPLPDARLREPAGTDYASGREIGDEYRYILERRFAKRYPGNMLPRPGLLLNPWALDSTNNVIGIGGGAGGAFGGRFGGKKNLRGAGGAASGAEGGPPTGPMHDLDYLPGAAVLLSNLRPGEDGVVRVPLVDLGDGQHLRVVAVDGRDTVTVTVLRPEVALRPRDRRLLQGLDPARHLVEERRIELLQAGAEVRIEDASRSQAHTVDDLGDVYALYRTEDVTGELDRFEFLPRWPGLERDEQLALYGEHACHELHLFLYEKDRVFFDEVVRAYLANKLHKTFLDRWLLEEDLLEYLDPWAFGRLNVVERILLARRVTARQDDVARALRERLELTPEDPAELAALFDTVLESGKLGQGGGAGLRERLARKAAPPAAAPMPDPAARPDAPAEEPVTEDFEVEEEADMDDGFLALDEKSGNVDQDLGEDRRAGRSRDQARREAETIRPFDRGLDPTRAYVEHDYFHRRVHEMDADLIGLNGFWVDLALCTGDAPLFSPRFAEATGSVNEMLLALALLDLPFEAGEHTIEDEGEGVRMVAASPLVLVREDLAEAELDPDAAPLILGQSVVPHDEPTRVEEGRRVPNRVTGEFLTGVTYVGQVVLTNPTPDVRELEVLLQIPRGALPASGGRVTDSRPVRLDGHGTASLEYRFWFPLPGEFSHYPAHVGEEGALVAFGDTRTFRVVRTPSTVDTTSWTHVSQEAELDAVLTFLGGHNLEALDLGRIAWRMRDADAWRRTLELLRGRLHYQHELWSFALLHEDDAAAREYLSHSGQAGRVGRDLRSPLLTVDPVERHGYQHVEFDPLVNARAHRYGAERRITDDGLARQYLDLLDVLAYRAPLDAEDWLSVTYYLALQDRVEETLEAFERVDADTLPTRVQYDYLSAYLDFYSDAPTRARRLAEAYADHPVPRWRARFAEVRRQLDEIEGVAPADPDGDPRTDPGALVAREPQLALAVEDGRILLDHANLEGATLSFYEMDVEFLFSTSPFVQQGSGSFAYVQPRQVLEVELGEDGRSETALPADLQGRNVLVEARAGGLVRRETSFAHSLTVQTLEGRGQLHVTAREDGRALPRVYVKVYARGRDGEVRFHKDGYTDLRGRFDYAHLSGSAPGSVQRFAILVLSEEDGAVVREVDPPTR